jgi:ubiquinone/menaquinone biosynthesis C-methylase UbiE
MPLDRVLEPEVMDSEEEARDYDLMDHAAVNAAFCDDLLALAPDLSSALDLGTGTALIPIEICRREGDARIVAIDLAPSMIALAKKNVERAGFASAISIELVDAKSMPYRDGAFRCAISNSILHHIPDPMPALREALRVTQPGGWLFIRDLLRPDNDEQVSALVDAYARGASERQRLLFDASLRAAFTLSELRDLAARLGIPERALRQTSDRHWTLAWMRPRE